MGSGWCSGPRGLGGVGLGSCLGVAFLICMASTCSSPLPEPFISSMDTGTFPVNAVVGLVKMNGNAILEVSSSQ